MISIEQLLGLELPSKRVTDYFLSTYIDAVHNFMMIFHEPTFRADYEKLMSNRRFPRCQSNHVIFILLVLCIGAHYASDDEVLQKFPTFQLKTFRSLSLKRIEDSMHSLYDCAELEAVQVCGLLGSWYVYHGRPNRAFVILGAGVRCAQLLLLHRESAWRCLSEIAKEERRRVFWALFVFDRFASTIFGRPCGISLDEIDVKFPQNMGDTTLQHPKFRSTATMPDGSVEPVTAFSYFKYKIKLYQISSPIIGDLYFHRSSSVSELASKVDRIDKELSDFFNALPPELKLAEVFQTPAEQVTPKTRPFALQALALQIAYDNVQILLHRPLLSQDLRNFKAYGDSNRSTHSPSHSKLTDGIQLSSGHVHQILLASRDKCWDSALRSSRLGQYQQCLVSARDGHIAAFLGINLFTAGMVLCVIALSRPLSSEAQMAKQAVARIMTLSRFLAEKTLLSAQTSRILKDLVHLIGEKEIKTMLSESGSTQDVRSSKGEDGQSVAHVASGAKAFDISTSTALELPLSRDDTSTMQLKHEFALSGMDDVVELSLVDDFDFSGFENVDFNNGLSIMQQAMFPEMATLEMDAPNRDWLQQDGAETQNAAGTEFVASTGGIGSNYGLQADDFNVMSAVGQTWLWDGFSW